MRRQRKPGRSDPELDPDLDPELDPDLDPELDPDLDPELDPDLGQQPPISAKSPGDLLGVVPYLLGFHPAESLVVVLLGRRRVVMTARMDVDALDEPTRLAGYLAGLCREQGALGLITITYSASETAPGRSRALVAELGPQLVVDALVANAGRWWSLICDGPCCPAEGTPYDPESNAVSAAAVYAGLSALPDRDALEALVAGPPTTDLAALDALAEDAGDELATASVSTRKRLARRLVRQAVAERAALTDAECLRLAVLVQRIEVRDVAWAQLTREDADDHLSLWQRVVARTPHRLAAAPLCLLGVAAWVAGNGALQNCCTDRVARLDPDYSMARLLADINRRALPPSYWDELLREFRRHPDMLAG